MKYERTIITFILMALIALLSYCHPAEATTFSDIKVGYKQIGDSQWNVGACMTTTTCSVSSESVGNIRGGWGFGSQRTTMTAGQYIMYAASGDSTLPWNATLYNSNGTVNKVLGKFRVLIANSQYAFITNDPVNAGNGHMIAFQANLTGGAYSFTGTSAPTSAQMDTYSASYSPNPLAVGATYTPPGPTYPSYMTVNTPAPSAITYGTSASITSQQQSNQTSALSRQSSVSGNSIYIEQIGDNNTIAITQDSANNRLKGVGQQNAVIQGNSNNVTIRQGNSAGVSTGRNLTELRVVGDSNTLNLNQGYNQTGTTDPSDSNNHYQMLNITGSTNTVTTVQKDTASGTGHFMETTVSGNNNTIDLKQSNAGGKTMFTNVNGNSNSVTATQSGNANHYLETNLLGNGNIVTATQSGNTQNKASISITNSGGPGAVDLQQSGGANYNITTTCVTAGGCGAVVIRQ